MIPTVACIGEAMVELGFPDNPATAQVGYAGDTLNTAVYLKRAAHSDTNVAFVSAIGTDTFSDKLLEFVAAQHLDTRWLQRLDNQLPGLYAITTDKAGERTFNYWRENSAARELLREDPARLFAELSTCKMIYFSGITLAILPPDSRNLLLNWLSDYRKQPDGMVAFDSNYRPRLWKNVDEAKAAMARAWSVTDIALPSLDDEQLLFGDDSAEQTRERLLDHGVTGGAVKRGASGPLAIPDTVAATYASATKVVDTTAAGDSFNGAYLAKLLDTGNQQEALQAGHQCAISVIGASGAIVR